MHPDSLTQTGSTDFFFKLGEALRVFLDNPIIHLLDILILACVLFVAVRFIRGRKAGVLLIGISVLLLIMGIAHLCGFSATKMVFAQFFSVGIVALVIIFHPEIREALERVGNGSISGIMSFGDQRKKQEQYTKIIEDVSVAVGELSSTKTGALIVIARTINLDEVTNTGVKLNSEVSSFLIRNLFFNKAPLHDGAIIIDDGRIAAAGCLLPLTRRTDLDSDVGTRHRAAVGMSEVSDAIIVVVSEETGTISVAHDCTLTRGYTSDSLRKFLTKSLIKRRYSDAKGDKTE
ncbi:MAG: diadenylate cyclase CdaA [Clostridia bacterium]|nr:diadenylate cyclase CdaA [Clostridia bacterium]